MNKIKKKSKHGLSEMTVIGIKGQQLNENEVHVINANKVEGLLHVSVERKGSSFKLIYNITGFITLREYLATPLNKERFAKILRRVRAVLKQGCPVRR